MLVVACVEVHVELYKESCLLLHGGIVLQVKLLLQMQPRFLNSTENIDSTIHFDWFSIYWL